MVCCNENIPLLTRNANLTATLLTLRKRRLVDGIAGTNSTYILAWVQFVRQTFPYKFFSHKKNTETFFEGYIQILYLLIDNTNRTKVSKHL